jgi:hypothetical protein
MLLNGRITQVKTNDIATKKFCLQVLASGSRMRLLTIAAASLKPTKLAGNTHHSLLSY